MASGGWEWGQKAIHSFSTGYPQVIPKLSTGCPQDMHISTAYPQVIHRLLVSATARQP